MCNYSILFTGLDYMAAESGVCSQGKSRGRKGEPAYAGSFDYVGHIPLPGRLKLCAVPVCHQGLLKGRRDIVFSFL